MRSVFVLAFAALAALGCVTPSQPGAEGVKATIQVQQGREFELAVLQDAKITGTSVTVRFLGVTNDSRCPSDVKCVWAGNAIARFNLSAPGQQALVTSLNSTLDPKSVQYGGITLSLTGLKPVPKSGSTIPATDYVAVLTTGT